MSLGPASTGADPVREGTVLRSRGGVYTVALDDGDRIEATLRGRLKRGGPKGGKDRGGKEERDIEDRVVIGDRVVVEESSDSAFTVEEVLHRESEIVRRAAGGRGGKVVAANVDRIIAVVAAARPDPTRETVDRLLLIAEANDVDGVLVVNKMDLEEGRDRGRELAEAYGKLGYEVLTASAVTGEGMAELSRILCRGTSALLGPSGAGKSSLLNRIEPELELRIGELSRRPGRGRHTTVSARLIELPCGGWVADTPGFSDVGLWGVEPESLDRCFPDFHPHLTECRFRGCAHLEEPGCGVKRAVEAGEVSPDRYESYRRIREEAAEASAPPWQR